MPRSEELPSWMNTDKARDIATYRAVGYSQKQIADELGISQQTVSRYLRGLRDTAKGNDDLNKFFIGLILGGLGAALLAYLLRRK
jgi:transcriptional regulator with XRE-family HTH domain